MVKVSLSHIYILCLLSKAAAKVLQVFGIRKCFGVFLTLLNKKHFHNSPVPQFYIPFKYFSASIAALQPLAAAVIA